MGSAAPVPCAFSSSFAMNNDLGVVFQSLIDEEAHDEDEQHYIAAALLVVVLACVCVCVCVCDSICKCKHECRFYCLSQCA